MSKRTGNKKMKRSEKARQEWKEKQEALEKAQAEERAREEAALMAESQEASVPSLNTDAEEEDTLGAPSRPPRDPSSRRKKGRKSSRRKGGSKASGKKRNWKKKLDFIHVLMLVVIMVVVGYAGVEIHTIIKLNQEQAQLKKEYKELKTQKSELKEELGEVNDTEYIEEQARKQLRMVKPGEILYILQDDNSKDK